MPKRSETSNSAVQLLLLLTFLLQVRLGSGVMAPAMVALSAEVQVAPDKPPRAAQARLPWRIPAAIGANSKLLQTEDTTF